ncbi:MAG: acetyl-CoA carboxylase biotin carboxyl carrier protein subunit [Betaproteobacteria bacterium]|nr:acetyl-CoA carboxylase biotin carboxyl carrier protein subunit [Betaproteobacteria bacterium]
MPTEITAPMSGRIAAVLCKPGDQVKLEDELLMLEALKMENPIFAPADGKVVEIKVAEGAMVEANQVLMVID